MGFLGSTVSMVLRFTGAKFKFGELCLHAMFSANRWQNPILILVCGELAIQLILHGLTWKRTIWDFRTLTLFRPTLLPLLNRDGLKVFAGILGIAPPLASFVQFPEVTLPVVAMISIGVGVFRRGTAVVFIFPLLITFISASVRKIFAFLSSPLLSEPKSARTILHLQALSTSDEAPASSSKSSNEVELTTIQDLTTWEVPWDTSTLLHE
ncbi:hypothetical protein GYMLUDRAFT_245330 [Collybiopsis luxurians FD-317 M1]|uniref:Unplaced genomic scaffold GYMLUscaffold_32, whole genome shotgun sequence n=1 Tax=Collybiopsis luxurians FD-317 M1 TaxID=944289 RepID=A0A0D0B715_9AGAR|nr:hypothetical protein GYMLUDRAFT_245330 [Collybiopsis luxurians FD-317 M1]